MRHRSCAALNASHAFMTIVSDAAGRCGFLRLSFEMTDEHPTSRRRVTAGGHRRVVGRRDRQQRSQRHHLVLERGAEQLFGYTAEEAVGRSITMLIPPDRLSEEDVVLGRIRKGQRVEPFDTIRWRKDGTLVDVSLTVSPIRDATARSSARRKSRATFPTGNTSRQSCSDLQHRLMGLAIASASILGSPDVDAVLSARSSSRAMCSRPTATRCGASTEQRHLEDRAIVWHLRRVRRARSSRRRRRSAASAPRAVFANR